MSRGYLNIVLHAHLPYVFHPEAAHLLEERWLFEGMNETYLPILINLERLIEDQIDFRLTISMSPTLMAMLENPEIQEDFSNHLRRLIQLAEQECERLHDDPAFLRVAEMYLARFRTHLDYFENKYQRRLLTALRNLNETPFVEIVTCNATHGFLPILRHEEGAVEAQVISAVENHYHLFGRPPRGMWLGECAFYPGLDEVLKRAGVRYFVTDTHSLRDAYFEPEYGTAAPVYTPAGVAAFARDPESSQQVWSSIVGYPGHPVYREFYRDIGYDLPLGYIWPYILDDGVRCETGIKYYRITGKSEHKEAYDPAAAEEKAAQDAGNFMFFREKQIEHLSAHMDRRPVITAPFDAELFGHWWFEGPMWLDFLFRKIAHDQHVISCATPGDYLEEYPVNQVSMPALSTWGKNGYMEHWINEKTCWTYPHLEQAARRLKKLVRDYHSRTNEPLVDRALRQAVRELLLAQGSDWQFIMSTETDVPYACRRFSQFLGRFYRIEKMLRENHLNETDLRTIEYADAIFPKVRYDHFLEDKSGLIATG